MSSNLRRLKIVAEGLGDMCKDVVFVGGAVAELYADDPAATEIRPTLDVDCVVELASYGGLQELEQLLRARKFVNDTESGVICRWKYNEELVDIMPAKENILGFTNNWYFPGMQHRQEKIFSNNILIYILPPLYYIATKIEAVRSRGGDDLRLSHDLEDLVYVLNNRKDIIKLFDSETDSSLTEYISTWAKEMLLRKNHREEIECMLPYGDYERVEYVIKILNHFSRSHNENSVCI